MMANWEVLITEGFIQVSKQSSSMVSDVTFHKQHITKHVFHENYYRVQYHYFLSNGEESTTSSVYWYHWRRWQWSVAFKMDALPIWTIACDLTVIIMYFAYAFISVQRLHDKYYVWSNTQKY